jgi:prepilin-type N-terminal cleavage/methylation domain-containing protein
MTISRKLRTAQAGFTLIEIIVAIVVGAIVGVVLFTYMGTQLIHSGDPIVIARSEGEVEQWMERIISDYVQEINKPAGYTTALATIYARDYTAAPYNMPAGVTLTRGYVTYNAAGDESAAGPGNNLKVTVQAGGYSLTTILTSQRVTDGDPTASY